MPSILEMHVLFWLLMGLWFGKAINERGLPFWYCILHFAKQLCLLVA